MPVSETSAIPEEPTTRGQAATRESGGRHATIVAAGILLSRIFGLVRESVFAHYFGSGAVAGIFRVAMRIPNFLQNLLGEGVLSSSFIPVYANLLARGDRDEADRLAGAVLGLLAFATTGLVAVGILGTPALVQVIAPGLHGAERVLAIRYVRVLFPAMGTLVLSAWCLGILNSHRRFFLSYAAPVAQNLAVIVVLLVFGGRLDEVQLGNAVSWGFFAGAALQLAVQLPSVLHLLGRLLPSLSVAGEAVRTVLRNFAPALVGRGVVQISAFLDTMFASMVSAQALAVLGYQQILYLLPISLFGMAVSASELPVMSSAVGSTDEIAAILRRRLNAGLSRIAFLVVPSAAAFLFLGDVIAGALFETGRQSATDTRYLWMVLMGSSLGLLAATMGRLYSSAFYALRDTRTPLRFAILRLAVSATLSFWSVTRLPLQLGLPREAGLVGITVATSLAAWTEYALLRRALGRRIGPSGLAGRTTLALAGAALAASAAGLGAKLLLVAWSGPVGGLAASFGGEFLPPPRLDPRFAAAIILGAFGCLYLALTLGARQLARRGKWSSRQ